MKWREVLLNSKPIDEKMDLLVEIYKNRLRKWFRYVVPLPFIPKKSQMYTIFFCSNFELGVKLTKDFYAEETKNPIFAPNNNKTYEKFLEKHPEKRTRDRTRSSEWKILWAVIKSHEDGLCDNKCKDLQEFEFEEGLQNKLEWLESKGYLNEIQHVSDAWDSLPKLYALDWEFVEKIFGVSRPKKLNPLPSDTKIPKTKKMGLDQFL